MASKVAVPKPTLHLTDAVAFERAGLGRGSGAGRDEKSPVIISGPLLPHCWRIFMSTSRLCSIQTSCYGRLGGRVPIRCQQPNHWPMPHDLFGSV
jgi:hypothetical protein